MLLSESGITDFFRKVYDALNVPVLSIGSSSFSSLSILLFLLSKFLLFFFAIIFTRRLVQRILLPQKIYLGVSNAVGNIVKYLVIFIGLIIIFQTSGIDFTFLNILFGALGVGIGLGLQHIVNNFISVLIIFFESSIWVGDRIEVSNVPGEVVKISARATAIQTNDNITVIVPNSEFMNFHAINWNHNDRKVKLNLEYGVSCKEDHVKVKKIVLEVADKKEGVLKPPAPKVLFVRYGNSSIDLWLRFWASDFISHPIRIKSDIRFEIFRKFRENNIEIPFPRGIYIPNQVLTILKSN